MSNLFWWRWLLAVTISVAVFGLAMILLPGLMQDLFALLLYADVDGAPALNADAQEYITLIYGVLGAVMVGWMVPFTYILIGPFRRGERDAWVALLASLLIWYTLDTSVSLYSGFAGNAALNTVFLILFLIPLGATYRSMRVGTR